MLGAKNPDFKGFFEFKKYKNRVKKYKNRVKKYKNRVRKNTKTG